MVTNVQNNLAVLLGCYMLLGWYYVTVTFNLMTTGCNWKYMAFTPPELFSSLNNQNLDICVVTVKNS